MTLYLDRKTFFDGIKMGPFSPRITQSQVDGISGLLDAWDNAFTAGSTKGLDEDASLSYIVSGVMRETGAHMVPCREGCYLAPHGDWPSWTDAQARAFVLREGYSYAHPTGNPPQVWYGRGRIQNTWEPNYARISQRFNRPELMTNPDLLIEDAEFDAMVTVYGHIEGLWSVDTREGLGRPRAKLGLYFSAGKTPDFSNARRIVNGLDHNVEIAHNATVILSSVRRARLAHIS